MYDGNSTITKALIDAYALIGNRLWSVMRPKAARAGDAHRAV
jgi:hypothetical protein